MLYFRQKNFTLLEILISLTMLGLLIVICAQVLFVTVDTKRISIEKYNQLRENNMGWFVVYNDLANAVGVYYLDGTIWQGQNIPQTPEQIAAAAAAKTAGAGKKGLQRQYSSAHLLEFDAGKSEEPFLIFVASEGKTPTKDPTAFYRISYQLSASQTGEGQMLLRIEEKWDPKATAKSSDQAGGLGAFEEVEGDIESDFRRYMLLDGLLDVEVAVYNGEEWKDEWESWKVGDLPLALRINYRMRPTKKEQENEDDPEKIASIEQTEANNKVHRKVMAIPISNLVLKEPLEDYEF